MRGEVWHTDPSWPNHDTEDMMTMSEADKAILITGIRYLIVAIGGAYGVAKLEDDTVAGAIAAALCVLIYVVLGIVDKMRLKKKIERVEEKAEIAATTTDGLEPDEQP